MGATSVYPTGTLPTVHTPTTMAYILNFGVFVSLFTLALITGTEDLALMCGITLTLLVVMYLLEPKAPKEETDEAFYTRLREEEADMRAALEVAKEAATQASMTQRTEALEALYAEYR